MILQILQIETQFHEAIQITSQIEDEIGITRLEISS
jgi:hypothetical protein